MERIICMNVEDKSNVIPIIVRINDCLGNISNIFIIITDKTKI